MASVLRVLFVLAFGLSLTGCARSVRMVHQSDVYFEHCHAAELDESVTLQQRYQCWDIWLTHYTEGQPPHRIIYARQRTVALAHGEALTPLPGEAGGEVSPDGSYLAGVTAANRDEAEAVPRPGWESVRVRRLPRYRGTRACEPVCMPNWQRCINDCTAGDHGCVVACETEHTSCMRACP